jgi:hypothetical protein
MSLLRYPDAARHQCLPTALMAIGKLDIAALQRAFNHP